MNQLQYAKYAYSGGRKIVDNTVGKWLPLELASGVTGNAHYMVLSDRIILTGKISVDYNTQYSSGATLFSFPENIVITGAVPGIMVDTSLGYTRIAVRGENFETEDLKTQGFNIKNHSVENHQLSTNAFWLDNIQLTYTKS